MALRPDQQELQLNKLYSITIPVQYSSKLDFCKPSLWVNTGILNVYSSDSSTIPVNISSMTLEHDTISGFNHFNGLEFPKYIAFTQKSGTSTEIILNIATAQELADIT